MKSGPMFYGDEANISFIDNHNDNKTKYFKGNFVDDTDNKDKATFMTLIAG